MEKFCPSMEYQNKFFQLFKDGKFFPQYGIAWVDTESHLSAPTSFTPDWDNRLSVEPLFLHNFSKSFWKICPSVLSNLIIRHSLAASWLFRFSRCWLRALGHLAGRQFLDRQSARSSFRLFQLTFDGGSTSLIFGLSSNFSAHGRIAPVWRNAF